MAMQISTVPIKDLVVDPANLRKHGPRNVEAIRASLAKFGQQKPVVVGPKNVVVAGSGTVIAAREEGWTRISIVRTKLTGAALLAFGIADNRTSELAEWHDELGTALAGLKADGNFDHLAAGFTDDEIAALASAAEAAAPAVKEAKNEIKYTLTFLAEIQRELFRQFLQSLEKKYPKLDTVAERLTAFLNESRTKKAKWEA